MSTKLPPSMKVKFSISDVAVEVPEAFFERAGAKVAVFFGRKGRSALTRQTKWFTVACPSDVAEATARAKATRAASAAASDSPSSPTANTLTLPYGAMNDVTMDVEMRPISRFEGNYVFDQKNTHPMTVFAKMIVRSRPGEKVQRLEQDSVVQDLAKMEGEKDDADYSNCDEEEESSSVSRRGSEVITADALAATQRGEADPMKAEDVQMAQHLISESRCQTVYLEFPRTIDLSEVVNTKSKSVTYRERLTCSHAALIGTVVRMTVTAELPEDFISEIDEKAKKKEDKVERKRREEEERLLEKERKKEAKSSKKEPADNASANQYGVDITNVAEGGATYGDNATAAGAKKKKKEKVEKKESSFSPFSAVKNFFSSKEKPVQHTPFPLKRTSTRYPYLFILDQFELANLQLPPQYYRAVHIRLSSDAASVSDFPRLLLDPTDAAALREDTIDWVDGTKRTVYRFNFGAAAAIFGDKRLRNITGYDTLKALELHEAEARAGGDDDEKTSGGAAAATGSKKVQHDMIREQLRNTGARFTPLELEPLAQSAGDAQARPLRPTRVTAQLLVPARLTGVTTLKEERMADLLKERARRASAGNAAAASPTATTTVAAADDTSGTAPPPARAGDDSDADSAAAEGATPLSQPQISGVEVEDAKATSPSKAAPSASATSALIPVASRSFRLSSCLLNQEYIPAEGVPFRFKFLTEETLTFRARRVFLPSLCEEGAAGAAVSDVTLREFIRTNIM